MKTVLAFLLPEPLSPWEGIYLYHKFGPKAPTIYVLEITKGRARLSGDVAKFEELLNRIDPKAGNGSHVNIRPQDDNSTEVVEARQSRTAHSTHPPAAGTGRVDSRHPVGENQ